MEEREKAQLVPIYTDKKETTKVEITTPVSSTIDSDKKLIKEFTSDPENKKRAAEIAFQIKKDFPNWFTVPRLVKKFKVSTTQCAAQIEMLMFFNFCVGKVEKSIPYFRIDLDSKIQRDLLVKQIAEKEGEILFLKEKLSNLS